MPHETYKHPEPFLSNTSAKQIPTVIAVFFIADIALLLFYVANQAVGEPFYSLNGWLDLNSEASLATWYSVIQLA